MPACSSWSRWHEAELAIAPHVLVGWTVPDGVGQAVPGGEIGAPMSNPFLIDSPTCISFSGGRTSAYMLWRVLEANGGLPDDCAVVFANTGKEEEETLKFVRDCGVNWQVPIEWIEWRDDDQGYALVDFESASRNGEPFEALILKRQYLPNPVTRFCTSDLKIKPMYRLMRDANMLEDGLQMMVGIRADENRRVVKMRNGKHSESAKIENVLPLAADGITVHHVNAFLAAQPFNLQLSTFNGRTLAGNCDLCFLKPPAQRLSLVAERPARAVWWVRMEQDEAIGRSATVDGARFTKDGPSYLSIQEFAAAQVDAFDHDQEAISCFCGD